MARGLTREQIGVTEEMILTYGERIWDLSTNIQVRRGDPVRELDWNEIEAQRHGRGMADGEIADEIGLTREQVLYIRLVLERRRFRRENYHRLYELGGGRRFRLERFVPHEHRFGFRTEAIELRKTLEFDPRTAGSYLRLGYWSPDTVATWLDKWAGEHPDHPAIAFAGQSLSYADVRDRAVRLANGFMALGIRRGDVVAVRLNNVPEAVIAYLATCAMGAVAFPLPASCAGDELEAALEQTSARAVICHQATADDDAPTTMLNIGLKLRPLEHIVVLSDNPPEGTVSFDALIANADGAASETRPVASDPALLCLGAMSAEPRTVLHSYHTLLSNTRIVAPIYGLQPDDRVLSTLPLSGATGLGVVNLVLHAGATLLLAAAPTVDGVKTAIAKGKPSVLFTDASDLESCAASGVLEGPGLDSIRKATVTGASCAAETLAEFDAKLTNGAVARMWGRPECLLVLHTPFDAPEPVRHRTLGTAIGSFAVRMMPPSGPTAVPPGGVGEMQVRGCSLFAGYVGDRDANRIAFSPDGWFRTGVPAMTDEDGNVRLIEGDASGSDAAGVAAAELPAG